MTPMRLRKGGLYFRSLRPFARLDRRSHAGAARGRPRDMGSPFDFFSPKSWPSDTSVSDQAQQNRALLAAVMIRGGFRPYDREWWHFTLNNEPFPDTYFDFPVR